jgi:DNA-binding PadR family transcriptional regulator
MPQTIIKEVDILKCLSTKRWRDTLDVVIELNQHFGKPDELVKARVYSVLSRLSSKGKVETSIQQKKESLKSTKHFRLTKEGQAYRNSLSKQNTKVHDEDNYDIVA